MHSEECDKSKPITTRCTDSSTPLAEDTMSVPTRKGFTCQWIKTEPVEENETSDAFHQFQSEPVDKSKSESERKEDVKPESLTVVGVSCGQMSSGTKGSFKQSQFSPKGYGFKMELHGDIKTEPDEAVTSSDVNTGGPDIYSCDQTEAMTDIKVTVTGDAVRSESVPVTSMDEDQDQSLGDEQNYYDPFPSDLQGPECSQPATSVTTAARPFVCDVCCKTFTQKRTLKAHRLIHTGQEPFVCEVCNKKFRTKGNLKIHSLVHSGQKAFMCDVCYKSFTLKGNLTKHKLIHAGHKSFVCDVCDKSFLHKFNLKTHMLLHTDLKSFACDFCEESFSTKEALKIHRISHTGQKCFMCQVCNKSFTQASGLKTHMLIHTGHQSFVCDICDKSFNLKSNLTKHKFIHTGLKPFVCEVCGKRFTHKFVLQRHKSIHSDKKLFVCGVCDEKFTHESDLEKHKLIHVAL